MRLGVTFDAAAEDGGVPLWHDAHESFGQLLRDALFGNRIGVALGPLYDKDPAEGLLLPFKRSARESTWEITDEESLAPYDVLERAKTLRVSSIDGNTDISGNDLNDWTRAGLVLEISRRRGIYLTGTKEIAHVPWKLRGTVTGRFGTEPIKIQGANFNPLSLSEDDRRRIRGSDYLRMVAVIDFRAMDLCSMISLVPGLAERYGEHYDLHTRTAELLLPNETISGSVRDILKKQLFTYSYGGTVESVISDLFDSKIPELSKWFKSMPHGEGARRIQTQSSLAFRAGLSKALDLLVGENIKPMFTVHDELTLDVSDVGQDKLSMVSKALEDGASQRIGVTYRTRTSTGYTYQEAKQS